MKAVVEFANLQKCLCILEVLIPNIFALKILE